MPSSREKDLDWDEDANLALFDYGDDEFKEMLAEELANGESGDGDAVRKSLIALDGDPRLVLGGRTVERTVKLTIQRG